MAARAEYLDDEINLYDLYAVLVRWKWVVLGVWLVCVVLATVYAVTRPTVYTYTAVLGVAHVQTSEGLRPVEPPEGVAAQLEHVYGVSADPQGSVVVLSAEAEKDPAERVQQAAEAVVQRHGALLVEAVSTTQVIGERGGVKASRTVTILALGAVIGLMLGALAAFVADFLSRAHQALNV